MAWAKRRNLRNRIGEAVKHLFEQLVLNGIEERLVEKQFDFEVLREVANDEIGHRLGSDNLDRVVTRASTAAFPRQLR